MKKRQQGQRLTKGNRATLKRAFLEAFEQEGGNVTRTCSHVGITRSSFYDWLAKDAHFNERYQALEVKLFPPRPVPMLPVHDEANFDAMPEHLLISMFSQIERRSRRRAERYGWPTY